jgi:hypothetical protein
MIMKINLSALIFAAFLTVQVGCVPNRPEKDPARELREIIAPKIGLVFEGDLKQGEEKNFVGVRSKHLLLSRRIDSRTYFIQDERWGLTRSGDIFQGSDEELIERTKNVAISLGIDPVEISEASVMQVMNNVASVNPKTGMVKTEKPQKGERYGRLTRSVRGLAVFSSGVLMTLDLKGDIGFLELHWPELPNKVIAEASRLQEQVSRGWKPPQLTGAKVESIEAGVIHSPALGFEMDITPVIRVIYRSSSSEVGKKAVIYLNRDGHKIKIPRQFEKLQVPEEKERKRD